MALTDAEKANFDTLRRAFANGDAALLEGADKATGTRRAIICAVQPEAGGILMVPLAALAWDDPYDLWVPPA